MSGLSDLAGTVTGAVASARDTVGGAISYIGTATDTAVGLRSSTKGLLGNKAAASGTSGSGTIKQTERLLTVRPRSTPMDNKNKYTSERGPIASIKLASSRNTADTIKLIAENNGPAAGHDVDSIAQTLLSEGGYTDFLLTNVDRKSVV